MVSSKAQIIGAGLLSGLLYAQHNFSPLPQFIHLLSIFFCTFPLFIIGLSQSTKAFMATSLFACLTIVLFATLPEALFFLTFFCLPVGLLIQQTLRREGKAWYPLHLAIGNLSLIALLFFLLLILFVGFEQLISTINVAIKETIVAPKELPQAKFDILVKNLTDIFPGVTITGFLVFLFINIVLAQKFLCSKKLNVRPPFIMEQIKLASWIPLALALSVLGSLFGTAMLQYIAKNSLLILTILCFFAGLGFIHTWCRNWPNKRFFLIAFYLFTLTLGWPILIVSGLGLVDYFTKLREQLDESIK